MRSTITIVAVALALASTGAMAGGRGGGGGHASSSHPSESVTLNYGKVNQTYTQQHRDLASGKASGKRQYKPIHFVKERSAASSKLRGNNTNNRKGGRYLAMPPSSH